ncbi:DUF3899 domain-containing protein [Robertmurraya andreesenii]|uniref:DUF3899 domain-containing protein n=1 Tax=Anoxybacillus andreesenii TaxID=1325932 RepID=A0ABT9UYX1_9BACL|nr:DUF3899 domain-containing protein [Robertmurraya andreesenii]MDQ0153896.1 hypothetical protein [Robertmurraya andreesenii]
MKKYFIQTFILFLFSEAIIFSFIFFNEMSLLSYINISFYIGSLFIFVSLLFFTVKSGFFDAVTKSFRDVFARKNAAKKDVQEMLLPSEMISFNIFPYLVNGLLIILTMLVALSIYGF